MLRSAEPHGGPFAAALLRPESVIPDGLTGPGGGPVARRYAIYRNNVTVGLVEALAANFPAVRRLVGDDAFRALALMHVRETPPASKLLFEYGHALPAFLERFEPLRPYPYLADVARLERLRLDAYHAEDAVPLDPAALSRIAPERLGSLVLTPHPAMRLMSSTYAVVSIVEANLAPGDVPALDVAAPEDALVTRPHYELRMRRLPPGGLAFFAALADGRTLEDAAGAAFDSAPGFDLAASIAILVASGAFRAIPN